MFRLIVPLPEPAMPPRPRSANFADRYWRTFLRKLGEDLDLAGKAMAATAGAAMFAPLATKGVIGFPNPWIGSIFVAGVATLVAGIHLQADARPDE
ncbi:MAG TPA: hypothetical protein VNW53_09545 [Phenylobacterium sp.]|uniref:hypothetical protein n=1 Tax=Phenylobacterium sp. TaxID=1871053 RepID=UPI002B951202|nr:hypothetical protein [Phenylobacterium sp.]HXA39232.1 hypothetical protein [Phenylobacterium sp.]